MQDCDLLWDYEGRRQGVPQLNEVRVYEAETIEQFRPKLRGSDVWRRVRENREERYHFLEAIPKEQDILNQGIPDLAIDFKRFFTMPAVEIERQIGHENGAKRRCRLEMPYREHLQARAAFYFLRVMLPQPHIYDVDPRTV